MRMRCALFVLIMAVAALGVSAEQGRAQETAPGERGTAASPPVFAELGRWIERAVRDLNDGLRHGLDRRPPSGEEAIPLVTGTAGNRSTAAPGLMVLPQPRIVRQRAHCLRAPNGGPDCARAAATICQAQGFKSGASLEVQSEEHCPVEGLLAQRRPDPDLCRTETYVVRSMCQ
jgi:hypothetical protein